MTGGQEPRFAGAHLVASAFPDDDGSAAESVTRALAEYADGGSAYAVQQALLGSRLLVPVVAMLDESDVSAETGQRVDKASSMATVTVLGANGKAALPVFTSVAAMMRWRKDARPSAVAAEHAAAAALTDADALLIDPAGPNRLLLAGAGLRALAAGRGWVPLAEDTELARILSDLVAELGATVTIRPAEDNDAELVVRHPAAEAPVAEITGRLVGSAALAERLDRGVRISFERHAGPR